MTHKERKGSIFTSAIPNVRKVLVIGIACALSLIFFFCSKNQTPVSSTPPAVKILSFAPLSARIGDQIVITGENFSADKSADSVFFTHGRLALIDSATTAKLYVRVPQGTLTGTIVVRTGTSVDTSKQIFTPDTLPLPTIINLQPGSGPLGTIITITGTNFDTTQGHTIITMNGVKEKIISISPTKIVVEIIAGATGAITITMNSDTLTTATNFTITKRNATITSFTPARGKVGTQVTITGTNFNPDTTGLAVTFGSVPAQVVSATATQIITVVPQGAVTVPISVSFFGEQTSSTAAFQVEGKYQFDSAYVEIGNVPVRMFTYLNGLLSRIDTENLSFSGCSFYNKYNGNATSNDTIIFTDRYSRSIGYGDDSDICTTKISMLIDTNVHSIKSIALTWIDSSISPGGVHTTDYGYGFSLMQFTNIPDLQDSIMIEGIEAQPYFVSGQDTTSIQAVGPADDSHEQGANQFLPFTDSTYIKIVLK